VRLLVCGGRDYRDAKRVAAVLDEFHAKTPVRCTIVGDADGADEMAFQWSIRRRVTATRFRAFWESQGKKAGPLRNQRMIDEGKPDHCIAFPGGRGTNDMIVRCRRHNIPVTVVDE